MLSQGKIVPFSLCSWVFGVTFGILTIVFVLYIVLVYKFTCHKLEFYAKIGYVYDAKLN